MTDTGADLLSFASGLPVAPLVRHLAVAIKAEWARNVSRSLQTAERVTGLSREDLLERLASDRDSLALVTRLLVAAGQNGHDSTLDLMGRALAMSLGGQGDAAEVILSSIADLNDVHIRALLNLANSNLDASAQPTYSEDTLLVATGLEPLLVQGCVAALTNAGLMRRYTAWDGDAWQVTELGLIIIEMLQERGSDPSTSDA